MGSSTEPLGRKGWAFLGALVAVVVWGGSFAGTKRALAELSVGTLLFGRSLLGVVAVGGWLASTDRLVRVRLADLPQLVLLSLLGIAATQLLQAHALLHSTSANTAWLVALCPVVTAGLARLLLGERLTGKLAGIAIAFAGTVLVVGQGAPLGDALRLPSSRGDALTLLSTVSWSLYTIYGRMWVTRYPSAVATAYILGLSTVAFAPSFVATSGWRELAALSAAGWLGLLYLGVACSGVAFALWYGALERMEASRLATFIYLEPLVAQLLAFTLLGEPLRGTTLAGGAAILAGVYLASRVPIPDAAPAISLAGGLDGSPRDASSVQAPAD